MAPTSSSRQLNRRYLSPTTHYPSHINPSPTADGPATSSLEISRYLLLLLLLPPCYYSTTNLPGRSLAPSRHPCLQHCPHLPLCPALPPPLPVPSGNSTLLPIQSTSSARGQIPRSLLTIATNSRRPRNKPHFASHHLPHSPHHGPRNPAKMASSAKKCLPSLLNHAHRLFKSPFVVPGREGWSLPILTLCTTFTTLQAEN